MIGAAGAFGTDFVVVVVDVDDDHYRAAVSYVVSTKVLFGKTLNSVHKAVARWRRPQQLQ